MPIKTYRPTTPTLRFKTTLVNDDLTTDKPYKPLLAVKQRTGGRAQHGPTWRCVIMAAATSRCCG